jgi:hypothetical protein
MMKKTSKDRLPDIVKTVGDKGYDVRKITAADSIETYQEFLKHMPDMMGTLPRSTWEPVALSIAKMFEDQYVPMKVDDDSEDNK